MHAVKVSLVEAEQAQHGFRCIVGQVGFFSVDHAGDDRRFRAACNALYRRHSLILALIDVTLRVILAETALLAKKAKRATHFLGKTKVETEAATHLLSPTFWHPISGDQSL